MGDKSVPSSGNSGPRDFSEAVHASFTQPPRQPHITVQIFLSDEEAAKVTSADVSAAVSELLARLGVDMGHCWSEVMGSGDENVFGTGRMPGAPR
jgi:hypothetical protein